MRLTTGAVLRGWRAERTGQSVSIVSASGTVTLPASKVVSIREVSAATVTPDSRLNVEGPRQAASERAAATEDASAWARAGDIAPLMRSGDLARAESEARRALVDAPGDARFGVALGEILLAQSRPSDAVAALKAVSVSGLPDPLRRARDLTLAEALSRLQRVDEAASVLALTPPDDAGRVAAARAALSPDLALSGRPFGSSAHFVFVGPPGTPSMQVEALLGELESMHAILQAELGGAPRDRITVLLYPGTEFWEATGMGAEVAALFDGKMRVPAGRLSPPSAHLSAALRHEMTHAFVEALSGSRADKTWHEGLAEHFEGSDARPVTRALSESLRRGNVAWPPDVTHATSHARLEWFLGRWGMEGARAVLAGMASRGTIDAAVRAATGLGNTELDAAWRRDLLAARPR